MHQFNGHFPSILTLATCQVHPDSLTGDWCDIAHVRIGVKLPEINVAVLVWLGVTHTHFHTKKHSTLANKTRIQQRCFIIIE